MKYNCVAVPLSTRGARCFHMSGQHGQHKSADFVYFNKNKIQQLFESRVNVTINECELVCEHESPNTVYSEFKDENVLDGWFNGILICLEEFSPPSMFHSNDTIIAMYLFLVNVILKRKTKPIVVLYVVRVIKHNQKYSGFAACLICCVLFLYLSVTFI